MSDNISKLANELSRDILISDANHLESKRTFQHSNMYCIPCLQYEIRPPMFFLKCTLIFNNHKFCETHRGCLPVSDSDNFSRTILSPNKPQIKPIFFVDKLRQELV